MTHFITYGQSQQQYQRKMPYNEAKKQQNLVIQSLLHVSSLNSLGARMDMHTYTQAYKLSSFKKSGAR